MVVVVIDKRALELVIARAQESSGVDSEVKKGTKGTEHDRS